MSSMRSEFRCGGCDLDVFVAVLFKGMSIVIQPKLNSSRLVAMPPGTINSAYMYFWVQAYILDVIYRDKREHISI